LTLFSQNNTAVPLGTLFYFVLQLELLGFAKNKKRTSKNKKQKTIEADLVKSVPDAFSPLVITTDCRASSMS